ncbi:MAG TPA: helix-turn-helix transcriptional regulator [Trebonia sp.]|nr:helix-turn-helix transcriptional regulator [Trebonia sp.]
MVHRAQAVGKRNLSTSNWQLPPASAILVCHQHPSVVQYQPADPVSGTDLGPGCGRKRPPVPEARSPTVRRRELGALLRALRNEQGLTVDQAAAELLCSPSKVSRMETGQRGATARDIRDLCDLYGVTDPAERARMTRLAAEGKQQGWWQSYELDYFATYVGLEESATSIRQYQSTTIPGLLQTPDYVRAMSEVLVPEVPDDRVDVLVEVKMRRQSRLIGDPPLPLRIILDEAVLHRAVGGPAVMSAQLDHVVSATRKHDVTVQVIPFSSGAHPAMDSTFTILGFAESVASVVYVEGLVGWIYIERPHDVVRYEQVFEKLRSSALSPQESAELIARISANFRREAKRAANRANIS